jgi:hypothetical protein
MNICYLLDKFYYREGRTDNFLKPETTDNVLYYITSQSNTRYQDSTFSIVPSPTIPRTISGLIDFLCFNATFHNISAISWRPVLVVEETGVPGENHRPWASNWKTLSLAVASRVHPFL